LWKRRLFSIDVDRWWKLREGIPLKMTVVLTVSVKALRFLHQADQRLTEAVDD
jgi:hypothetical protein